MVKYIDDHHKRLATRLTLAKFISVKKYEEFYSEHCKDLGAPYHNQERALLRYLRDNPKIRFTGRQHQESYIPVFDDGSACMFGLRGWGYFMASVEGHMQDARWYFMYEKDLENDANDQLEIERLRKVYPYEDEDKTCIKCEMETNSFVNGECGFCYYG